MDKTDQLVPGAASSHRIGQISPITRATSHTAQVHANGSRQQQTDAEIQSMRAYSSVSHEHNDDLRGGTANN